VVNVKACGAPSDRPAALVAAPSMVTVNVVAYGSGVSGSGVKSRTVVPDQRNVPAMAGVMRIQGGVGLDGIRPSATIGSENTTRISAASEDWLTSFCGADSTTRRRGACDETCVPSPQTIPAVSSRLNVRRMATVYRGRP